MRSLNNLLERFHQSFFFYLLPSPTRYVSIGVYMPPFMIMSCGLVLSAVSLWLQSGDWLHFPDASKFADGMHGELLVSVPSTCLPVFLFFPTLNDPPPPLPSFLCRFRAALFLHPVPPVLVFISFSFTHTPTLCLPGRHHSAYILAPPIVLPHRSCLLRQTLLAPTTPLVFQTRLPSPAAPARA